MRVTLFLLRRGALLWRTGDVLLLRRTLLLPLTELVGLVLLDLRTRLHGWSRAHQRMLRTLVRLFLLGPWDIGTRDVRGFGRAGRFAWTRRFAWV